MYDLATEPSSLILPGRLRPKDDDLFIHTDVQDKPSHNADSRLSGNFILNARLVEEHFNEALKLHIKFHPLCNGLVTFNPSATLKQGFGIISSLRCSDCGFEHKRLKFFEEEVGKKGRGRRAAKINKQMSVALIKQPLGASSIIEILSACDISTPSLSSLQKCLNQTSDAFIEINREQLHCNRELIHHEMNFRKGINQNASMIQSDVSYNNSPKGRSFSQPGTQAYCPIFSSEKGLSKIPVSLSTVSKLCSCRYKKNGRQMHSVNCQRDFPADRPISNAEYILGLKCGEDLLQSNFRADTVITDGVGPGQLFKGINHAMTSKGVENGCENQDCSKHISSTLRRNMRKITLESVYVNDNALTKRKKQDRLLDFISRRCNWEFRALHKICKNIDELKHKCAEAKHGILACVQGDGKTCQRKCYSCYLHRRRKPTRTPRCLPDAQFIHLSKADEARLLLCMDKKLGPQAVENQRLNLNTNRCEASHRTVQRSLPKSKTFIRTFKGRVHSAMHSMSLGHVRSIIIANKKLGVENNTTSWAFRSLKMLHKRQSYQKFRSTSRNLKKMKMRKRIHIERQKANYEDFRHGPGCYNSDVECEHNYIVT